MLPVGPNIAIAGAARTAPAAQLFPPAPLGRVAARRTYDPRAWRTVAGTRDPAGLLPARPDGSGGTGRDYLRAAFDRAADPVVSDCQSVWRRAGLRTFVARAGGPGDRHSGRRPATCPSICVPAWRISTAQRRTSRPIRNSSPLWRRRLAQLGPGRKVGIAWRAGQSPLDRLRRWVPLRTLARIVGGRQLAIRRAPGRRHPARTGPMPPGWRPPSCRAGRGRPGRRQRTGGADRGARSGYRGRRSQFASGRGAGYLRLGPFALRSKLALADSRQPRAVVSGGSGVSARRGGDWSDPIARMTEEFFNMPASPGRLETEVGPSPPAPIARPRTCQGTVR